MRKALAESGMGTPRAHAPGVGPVPPEPARKRKALDVGVAVINGLVGDWLHATNNDLALAMSMRGDATADRVVVLVHGLMCTDSVWTMPDGTDYGTLLARDFGYSPLYLRYNTGRSIEENGAELARVLGTLAAKEIVLLGYSMGGLVVRSACAGGGAWLEAVTDCIYLGTPHQGSHWERLGKAATDVFGALPLGWAQLVADVANVRSSGIRDLGAGARAPLTSIRHHFIVGSGLGILGDGMVSVASATDLREGQERHVRLHHVDLAHHPDVYEQIAACLPASAAAARPFPVPCPAFPAPCSSPKGAAALVADAVIHGAAAVERMQMAHTAAVFAAIRGVAGVVRSIF